jgi:hypothetical protein
LYEQLEENKAKQEAEYDAVTKALFAPPKGLDEDEAQHINDMEDLKRSRRESIQQQDALALDSFKLARMSVTVSSIREPATQTTLGSSSAPGTGVRVPPPVVKAAPIEAKIKVKKRRVGEAKEQIATEARDPIPQKNEQSHLSALSALGGYESDSD